MDWNFVYLPILLLCSAIFSMSETALLSLSPVKIQSLIKTNPIRGKIIAKLLSRPQKLLVTNSACNTTVNIFATLVATNIFNKYLPMAGYFTVVIVMTLMILIIGEVTPKTVAIKIATTISLIVAPVLYFLTVILTPFTFIFRLIAKFFTVVTCFLAYHDVKDDGACQNEEMIEAINQGCSNGVINKEESLILRNVLSFGDVDVHKMMRPRKDMFCLSLDTPIEQAIGLIKEKKYSRIPVFGTNEDDIKGILYARDLNNIKTKRDNTLATVKSVLRKPFYIPCTISATDALNAMKDSHHMAIVIDEYGEVCGLITIEDIFENIVGEVIDKDDIIPAFHKYSSEVGEFDGDIELDEFNSAFETNISSDDFVTLAGYVLEHLKRIPSAGEIFTIDKLSFKIIYAKPNKIEKMQVSKIRDIKKKEYLYGIKE